MTYDGLLKSNYCVCFTLVLGDHWLRDVDCVNARAGLNGWDTVVSALDSAVGCHGKMVTAPPCLTVMLQHAACELIMISNQLCGGGVERTSSSNLFFQFSDILSVVLAQGTLNANLSSQNHPHLSTIDYLNSQQRSAHSTNISSKILFSF